MEAAATVILREVGGRRGVHHGCYRIKGSAGIEIGGGETGHVLLRSSRTVVAIVVSGGGEGRRVEKWWERRARGRAGFWVEVDATRVEADFLSTATHSHCGAALLKHPGDNPLILRFMEYVSHHVTKIRSYKCMHV